MFQNMNSLVDLIREKALKYYNSDPGHDWSHAERVYKMCMKIMNEEGGDPEVLTAAALLHDVGISYEFEEGIDHSEKSAEIAGKILYEIGFPRDKIVKVQEAIRQHRFKSGIKATTLEAKILQDADRLDAIGAIGIARTFSHGGNRKIPIYSKDENVASTLKHFYDKLLKIRYLLNTRMAKAIAKERHEFMEAFLSRLLKEIEGEA
ncbi:MAG: HD domain-containing protein [Candidatus Brockarchaeota archaeon]|nr:HD domain-containing protein [Candidatus Brockarchaeota archaeon]